MDIYYIIGKAAECVQRVNDKGRGVLRARLILDWEEVTVGVFKNEKVVAKVQAPKPSAEWLSFIKYASERELIDLEAYAAAVKPVTGEEVEA